MPNTTPHTARAHYAVYSPRGFANEVAVQACDTAAEAKALDAGYNQQIRAKYIRSFRKVRDLGLTTEGSYTFLED